MPDKQRTAISAFFTLERLRNAACEIDHLKPALDVTLGNAAAINERCRKDLMTSTLFTRRARMLLAAATALAPMPANAEDAPAQAASAPVNASLEQAFRDPPPYAHPRVWWHWMNGNVDKDGIAADFAWMKRIGINGVQTFDTNLSTPQVVDKRLIYMTPEWQDAFRFAVNEAVRLGMELSIASSPGFSSTGGPWVPPEDGLKKLVWSKTDVFGGKPYPGQLPAPPAVTGPFQNMLYADPGKPPKPILQQYYRDIAVLAFPIQQHVLAEASLHDGNGAILSASEIMDGDYTSAVKLAQRPDGKPPELVVSYPKPQEIRSATVFIPGASIKYVGTFYRAHLEASSDGLVWRKVADIPLTSVSTTIGFPTVIAKSFRLVIGPAGEDGLDQGAPQAPGALGLLPPNFSKIIASRPVTIAEFKLSPESAVDRFEEKAGFATASNYYDLSLGLADPEATSPQDVINLTSRLRPDGTLDWTPPKGNWRILRLGSSLIGTTNHPAPPEATGLEVDKYDAPAVRRYTEHYLATYRDVVGRDMIGTRGVRAIVMDSIEIGAANWTPRMIERFRKLRGYDPLPWLPTLTGTLIGSRLESDKFLYDYRRTLADLLASDHYAMVAQVAHEAGLKVYAEALEDRRPSLGDDMSMRRHADFPMAAMWTYPTDADPRPTYLADVKGAASVAHVYGQNLVAAETMTSKTAPWAHSPADLKPVIDLAFALGVNHPSIHTSVHQPGSKVPGVTLGQFGQYFTRTETWAEMAKPWIDYIARNSLMLQQGRNVADVAYFYGEEAPITGIWGEKTIDDAPRSYAYDFVNAEVLATALSNDAEALVTPGGARYRVIYLGGTSRQITLPTLRRLAQLVEGGATLIGQKPDGSPSLADSKYEFSALANKLWSGRSETKVGKGMVIASSDVEAVLATIGVAPDFRFEGSSDNPDIPFVHRKLVDGDSYFLFNRSRRAKTIEARFRSSGKMPELWRAETGMIEPVTYRIENQSTVIPLTLAPEESVHVVFRKPASASSLTVPARKIREIGLIDGSWSVTFQKDRGAPASPELTRLAPLNESRENGVKYFSGTATYNKDFQLPAEVKIGQALFLDLGEVQEMAQVLVNGKEVGIVWHSPFRIDIGKALKRGRNTLEVRVATLWVNRLIGDAQPGADPITKTSQTTYSADAPLQRSGLIGPVRLLVEQR